VCPDLDIHQFISAKQKLRTNYTIEPKDMDHTTKRELPFRNRFGMNLLTTVAASSIYGVAYISLYGSLGAGIAALAALPVAVAGWALGLRGGILAGLIAFPMNTLLMNLVGETGWDTVIRSGGTAGSVVIVIIGGTLGKIRDLRTSLQSELRNRQRLSLEREKLISDLQIALGNVKTLSGMLPICASCKSIRDDSGYWASIEKFIRENSDAELSHSICPTCAESLYSDFLEDTD